MSRPIRRDCQRRRGAFCRWRARPLTCRNARWRRWPRWSNARVPRLCADLLADQTVDPTPLRPSRCAPHACHSTPTLYSAGGVGLQRLRGLGNRNRQPVRHAFGAHLQAEGHVLTLPMSGLAVPALRLRRSCRQPRRRGLVAFPRHNAQPRSATMPFCLVDLVKVEADLSGRRATCATVGAYLRPMDGPLGGSGMREGRGSGRLGRVRTGLRGPRFPAADGMRGRPVRRGRRGRE